VREPQFEGQTKTKLGNNEVKGVVEALVNENSPTVRPQSRNRENDYHQVRWRPRGARLGCAQGPRFSPP